MLKKILFVLLTTSLIISCSGNQKMKKYSDQQLEDKIVAGTTTKAQVEAMLGKPDKIDKDKNGREQWTYTSTKLSANPLNFIPVSRVLTGQNGQIRKLVLTFKGDVVYSDEATTHDGKVSSGIFKKADS